MMCRLPYDLMVSQGARNNYRFPVPDHHFIIQEDLDLSLMGGLAQSSQTRSVGEVFQFIGRNDGHRPQ